MTGYPFGTAESSAWAPPEPLSTSDWADRYRVLGPRASAVPGPWRTDRVPYTRAVMDALSDDEHEEVYLEKPAQSSGSELGRNWIGRCADIDPGPALVVFPSEQACKEVMEERIIPMFQDSPRLRQLLTGRAWDLRKRQLALLTCTIYTGWSGSPQALASRPIRYLTLDEMNKFASYTGREASPLELAKDRTLTYRKRRKVYGVSTPTIPSGQITQAVDGCGDIRRYAFRCERCGAANVPDWRSATYPGQDAVDEDEIIRARLALEDGGAVAFYTCSGCAQQLTDADLVRGVKRGAWVSEGRAPGDHPRSASVGFRLHGLVSPWIGLTRLAVEELSARVSGLAAVQNFNNSLLGVPFWDDATTGDTSLRVEVEDVMRSCTTETARGMVPRWATCVVAGVDTAAAGYQYVVRAFGQGFRSMLLAYGEAPSAAALEAELYRDWPVEGGQTMRLRRLCVDIGGAQKRLITRTEEVYQWCADDPTHRWPVKGHGGSGEMSTPLLTSTHTYHPPGEGRRPYDVKLTVLDTLYFKDLAAQLLLRGQARAFTGLGRDYAIQVASERKILAERRITAGSQVKEIWRWVVKSAGAKNHFWDCECYALVAAYMLNVGRIPARDERPTPKRPEAPSRWKIGR